MKEIELKSIYKILKSNGYYPEYLYLELGNNKLLGVYLEHRLTKEKREEIRKLCGDLEFFEVRSEDEDEYSLIGFKKRIFVDFDGTFLIRPGEIKVGDDEELEITDYSYVSDLNEWLK